MSHNQLIIYGAFCVFAAVQHERGPRKPKNKGDPSSGGGMLSSVGEKMSPLMLTSHPPPPPPPPSLGGHLPVLSMPAKPEPTLSLPSPDTAFSATSPIFMPQPPGLLQILVSAEKCQVSLKHTPLYLFISFNFNLAQIFAKFRVQGKIVTLF